VSADGDWKKDGTTTFSGDQQFALTLDRPTDCYITVQQDDSRSDAKRELAAIRLEVFNKGEWRENVRHERDLLRSIYSYQRQVGVEGGKVLKPGSYNVVPMCELEGAGTDSIHFTLTVHSKYPVTLTPLQ
jgi:hypothetical protein